MAAIPAPAREIVARLFCSRSTMRGSPENPQKSALGQTEKHSARADVFRSYPKNGRWFRRPKQTLRGSNLMEFCSDKSAFLSKSSAAYMPHSSPMDAKL